MRIFLSYDQRHLDRVDVLMQDLRSMGHEVWFDRELSGGRAWWDDILAEIRRADLFLPALTPAALASLYCRAELSYAMALGKILLPVLIDKVYELPKELRTLQVLDYRSLDKTQALALAKALFRQEGTPPPLPDPLPDPPPLPEPGVSTASADEPDHAEFRQALAHWDPWRLAAKVERPGKPLEWQAHPAGISSLEASPDGRWLLSGDRNGSARLWDLESGLCRAEWAARGWSEAVFLPGGRGLATAGWAGQCRLFSIPDGMLRGEFSVPQSEGSSETNASIWALSLTPDGSALALGKGRSGYSDSSGDGADEYFERCAIEIWSMTTGMRLASFAEKAEQIEHVAISPDGRMILIMGRKMVLRTVATGKDQRLFPAGNEPMTSGAAAFSRNGFYFATGGSGYNGRSEWPTVLWYVETMQKLRELPSKGRVALVRFSPDGRLLLTLEERGYGQGSAVRVWDLLSGEQHAKFFHPQGFGAVSFSSGGDHLLLGTGSGEILVKSLLHPAPQA